MPPACHAKEDFTQRGNISIGKAPEWACLLASSMGSAMVACPPKHIQYAQVSAHPLVTVHGALILVCETTMGADVSDRGEYRVVGCSVGLCVGCSDGVNVGTGVGFCVGRRLGTGVGSSVGVADGLGDGGRVVGCSVGRFVGYLWWRLSSVHF